VWGICAPIKTRLLSHPFIERRFYGGGPDLAALDVEMAGQGAVGLEEFVADVENVDVGQKTASRKTEKSNALHCNIKNRSLYWITQQLY
jgi:hypothetical protein